MPSIKNNLKFIKNSCLFFAVITGSMLVFTSEKALAGADTLIREITRVEWERGEGINCNGNGVELFGIAANVHFLIRNVAVACLTAENQAEWVIIGGVTYVTKNQREGVFLERFEPENNHSGDRPNLYSFANFTIGYGCRSESGAWECQRYSSPIENNVLKTFGSGELRSQSPPNSLSFAFKDLEGAGHYHTSNRK